MFTIHPINGETWLICGGRDFTNQPLFESVMHQILELRGCPSKVVHGAARGADSLAGEWARKMAIEQVRMPADWRAHGKAAGPIRNEAMLVEQKPKVVIAFPGGSGTADMVSRAHKVEGVDVIEVKLNG